MSKLHTIIIDHRHSHGERLDKAIADRLQDLSRSRIKTLIVAGQVKVNKAIVTDPSAKVRGGDVLCVTEQAAIDPEPKGQNIPLEIVYEDDDLLVINKPVGLVVHPAPGHAEGTLVNALIAHCKESLSGIGGVKRPGIVHRLDKDTSGLMVIAKNDQAHQHLSAQFQDRTLSRTYWAFVRGMIQPPEGTITHNIGRSLKNRKKMAVRREGGREAVTDYKTLACYGDKAIIASLVECTLRTGRTHQIRVHLNALGHPVIGDTVYGKTSGTAGGLDPILKRLFAEHPGDWPNHRQALHATRLKFQHPRTEKMMSFHTDLPSDMIALQHLLESLSS